MFARTRSWFGIRSQCSRRGRGAGTGCYNTAYTAVGSGVDSVIAGLY